jgi:endonuclease YncB( thermonuclease family)
MGRPRRRIVHQRWFLSNLNGIVTVFLFILQERVGSDAIHTGSQSSCGKSCFWIHRKSRTTGLSYGTHTGVQFHKCGATGLSRDHGDLSMRLTTDHDAEDWSSSCCINEGRWLCQRRQFLSSAAALLTATAVTDDVSHLANSAAATTTNTATSTSDDAWSWKLPPAANPFVRFETVGMIPKSYFHDHVSIYAFTERILDGDTIRVRHVPGYGLLPNIVRAPAEPLPQRGGIADDTLIVRLYGIDCPEIAKQKNQTSQPFAIEAKQYTSSSIYHQMVKVTLIRKDQYGRAIAMVETLPPITAGTGIVLANVASGLVSQDLSIELARNGLAELYTGGGAEYYVRVVISLLLYLAKIERTLSHVV